MDNEDKVWLAADYHFPGTYSCRMPMSSMNSALALPAPGPATVRLALLKVGIELYGLPYTRELLFPIIRSADVCIRPPEKVALSLQQIRTYKVDAPTARAPLRIGESVGYREYAHARGFLTVYIRVSSDAVEDCRSLLMAVGYWGQTSSLVYCMSVRQEKPCPGECVRSMSSLSSTERAGKRFSCVLSEFRDAHVEWDEIDPELCGTKAPKNPTKVEVYVWPMTFTEHHAGKVLSRIHPEIDASTGQRSA